MASSASPRDYRELAAVFVGGALGTLARAGLSLLVTADPARWPWPTFTVNIVGAFMLGYFTTRLLERLPLSSYRRPLLGTGVCGGLTTFSTMQVETLRMIEHRHYGLAIGYTCRQRRCSGLARGASGDRAGAPRRMRRMTTSLIWLGVILVGGLGAVLRFLLDGAVARRAGKPSLRACRSGRWRSTSAAPRCSGFSARWR